MTHCKWCGMDSSDEYECEWCKHELKPRPRELAPDPFHHQPTDVSHDPDIKHEDGPEAP